MLLLATALVAAGFAGGWNLDNARSEGVPPSLDMSLVIERADDGVRVHTTIVTDAADRVTDDLYIPDGEAHDFKPQLPGVSKSTGTRTAKVADANEMDSIDHVKGISSGSPITYDIERQWILSPDGSTLTVKQGITAFGSTTKSVRVFSRR